MFSYSTISNNFTCLSNNDDTPDQFQLFFSRFNIEQFIRLRSITLINIENDLLLNFIDTFNCQNLESLRIVPGYYSKRKLPKITLKKLFVHQLKLLNVYNASCINTQSVCYLKHLTVHDCEIIELQQILSSMPILQSLKVTNFTRGQWMIMDKVPIKLKRLALNLRVSVTIDDIEKFLEKLLNLKHLELQIEGSNYDLCDGQRWSNIVRHLITFDFDFKPENVITISPHLLVSSFSSSFWLQEKRWFVAYDNHPSHIFTVPRFAATTAYYSTLSCFHQPLHSTISSDQSLFYDSVSIVMIANCLCKPVLSHRFIHVKILSIPNLKLFDQLQLIIDMSQIQCLKLIDTISSSELEHIIPNRLPRIHELHLCALSKGFQKLNSIKQIHILHIQTVNSVSRLCRQFPCIERLYIENVDCYEKLRSILIHLKSHLSYVSLSWKSNIPSKRSFQLLEDSLKQDQNKFNFTYRCRNQYFSSVHLWINNNSEQSLPRVTTSGWKKWLFNGLNWLSRHIRLSAV